MKNIESTDALAIGLVHAIQDGDVAVLQRLLASQPWAARVGITDARGVTRSLLHIAADWPGHFPNGEAIVRTLAEAGADPNARVVQPHSDGLGETPLHWAASSDDIAVLDALIDVGADIEAPGAVHTGGSPMSDAVVFAQWRAARRLLANGAETTLWQAAALGLTERVQSVVVGRPEPPRREITNAFWHACRAGQRDTATLLIDRGAEMNWVGHDQKTPLDAALESESDDFVAWLREMGATSNAESA